LTGIASPAPGACGWERWQVTPEAALDVFRARGRAARPLAVLTGGIHGDEYEGPTAILEICRRLATIPLAGSVVAIPVVNPAAFQAGTRTSPVDGLNLARTFPGKEAGSLTERLAYHLFAGVASQADLLIDLHSGGVEYVFLPVAGFYGPASPANPSFAAAQRMGLRHLWALPPTAGVLSCECWKRGIVSVGAEYLGAGQLSEAGVRDYVWGVLACLAHARILDDDVGPLPHQTAFTGDWQLAETDGIFRACTEIGQPVERGARLAEIMDLRGEVRQTFQAPAPGVVLGLRSKAFLRAGGWAVLLGQPVEESDA